MKNSKLVKTSFEENNEVCNYQIGTNLSDLSDERTNPGTFKSRNLATPKSEKKTDTKKKSNSKKNSRKNSIDSSKPPNSNLVELVESLKEKISIYENDMKSLIEDKIQMQIQLNQLQLSSYQNMKKSGKLKKSGDLTQSMESQNEHKNLEETNTGLRQELNNMNNHLAKQRKLLDQNFSILNESVYVDSIFKRSNSNIIEIQKINCFTISKSNSKPSTLSLGQKSGDQFTISGSFSKNEQIEKLELQRERMLQEINSLKGELIYLMESQMQSQHNTSNDNIRADHKEPKNNIKESEAFNTQATKDPNLSQTKSNSEVKIPPLQNIFINNGKLLVLDQENYVWHLKKCRKYTKYVDINKEKFRGNMTEIFNAYFEDSYESQENTEEVKNPERRNEQATTQHMLIAENYIDDGELGTDNQNSVIDKDNEKENLDKTPIDDFDISKMSNLSNLVNEEPDRKKNNDKKQPEKKDDLGGNTSYDLSDDG